MVDDSSKIVTLKEYFLFYSSQYLTNVNSKIFWNNKDLSYIHF